MQAGAGRVQGTKRRIWNTVQVRVSLLLTLAILPLGLIAILQTHRAVTVVSDAFRSNLAAQTAAAARPEREAILRSLGIAATLADAMRVPDLRDADCATLMARVARSQPDLIFVGFIDLDGQSRCNNAGRVLDLSDSPGRRMLIEDPRRDVRFDPPGDTRDTPVVVVHQPVFGADEALEGFVSLSFPTGALVRRGEDGTLDARVRLVAFNGEGSLLASDVPSEELPGILPRDMALADLPATGQRIFSMPSGSGALRDFALVPIYDGKAYALGSWTPALPLSALNPLSSTTILFPLAMWIVTLGVAIWALRRQVVAPIRTLRMRMLSFADGRTLLRGNTIPSAPSELREIGAAFEEMADKIVRDEADLEDKVHEREILLREVHHRVKNNLQLMSSIINMQIRETQDAEARDALTRVKGRLASLARFHQDLYQSSALSKLRADLLLHDLARQVFNMGRAGGTRVDLDLRLEPVVLSPDQTSALAMLTTEALTNALKYTSADPGKPAYVRMVLRPEPGEGDRIRLEIENSVASDAEENRRGLGRRLILAFASQLEAEITKERRADSFLLSLVFERMPFKTDDAGTPTTLTTL